MSKKKNGVVKVTTSGQITLPKAFRDQFDTDIFSYEINGGTCVVRPIEVNLFGKSLLTGKKYTWDDLEEFIISSKCPEEKNITDQIDNIVYELDRY